MATVIQIANADFSGKGFPVITALYKNGLIGAFRPANSLEDTIDLSGNGATVNFAGNPIFHDTYVECDMANGLVTNLKESASMTYAFVARTQAVAGNFSSFLGGSYTGVRGLSLLSSSDGTRVQSQVIAKRNSDNTYQNQIKTIANRSFDTATLTSWGFWLVSVDAVNNTVTGYSSEGFVDLTTLGSNYADRDGLTRSIFIGKPSYVSGSTYPAKSHIAEALFYNRALSNDEILKVFDASRKSMAQRGIIF